MTNVPEERSFEELSGDELSEYRALPQKIDYWDYFCTAFASHAPLAFHSLIWGQELLLDQFGNNMLGYKGSAAFQDPNEFVRSWIADFGIVESQALSYSWLHNVAIRTILVAASSTWWSHNSMPGVGIQPQISAPTSLVGNSQMIIGQMSNGGMVKLWRPVPVPLTAPASVDIPSMHFDWDPLQETPAAFRERAKKSFLEELNATITGARSLLGSFPTTNVDHVDWYILWKFGNWKVNSLTTRPNSQNQTRSRSAIQDGINAAALILGLPERPTANDE